MSGSTSVVGAGEASATPNGFAREHVDDCCRMPPLGSMARAVSSKRERASRLDAPGRGGGDPSGRDLRAAMRDLASGRVAPEHVVADCGPAWKEAAR